jgi:long-chain acyl-CoA synthetase
MNADAIVKEREDINRTVAGQTVCSLFQDRVRELSDQPALYTKRDGDWQPTRWREYGERVRALSLAIRDLGFGPGQSAVILSGNREEYVVTDLAVLHNGGHSASLYQTLAPLQVGYIVNHSEAVLAFAEGPAQAETFFKLKGDIPRVKQLVLFEGADSYAGDPWVLSYADLMARGATLAGARSAEFEARWRDVKPEGLATLIYTSGTTGPPKGVMLTHGIICWTMESSRRTFDFEPGARLVSYLPLAHIAERNLTLYGPARSGATIYFCPDINQLLPTLLDVRPHAFFAVPRIWEKMHAALVIGIEAEPDSARRAAATQAIELGHKIVELEEAGQSLSLSLAAARETADAQLFARLRQRLGLDQVRLAATGAAPIAPEILRFFRAIGIPILEVYGQTEDCGPTSINRLERFRIGTVGLAYPGVEVKLDADGEILVRGGNVSAGYYKDPELTRETFTPDGWLRSGDIGEVDPDGFIRVVDRKKDIIITAGGKNVTPSNIENALKHQPLISQAMVVGDRRPYLVALLTLDQLAVTQWARDRALPSEDWHALLAHPELRAELQRAVDRVNDTVSRVEQVKKFAVLARDWSPDTEELTPTLKVKRKIVREKYAADIEALYAGD